MCIRDRAGTHEVFGALLQYPNARGEVMDLSAAIAALKAQGAIVALASDLMALVLLKSPGAMGAAVSYTHLRANETVLDPVCRLLLEKKK